MKSNSSLLALSLSLLASCAVLTGCGVNAKEMASTTATSNPGAIQGKINGGQNPVAGASIYVLEASKTAYAGPGLAASTSNRSSSLLQASSTTTADADGNYYVTSDSLGDFSISNLYSCDAGRVVYLYVKGGDSGAGVNPAIGMFSTLGVCPSQGGNFASSVPFVMVDEVSTIATAYALAGFMTDAVHMGYSGSAAGALGMQNAAASFSNLVDVGTGTAYTQTPGSVTGNIGTVPASKINTLANILAACVNSTGSGSTACSTLFSNIKSTGTSGDTATDTATAALYIAHNPGTNAGTLYGLQTAAAAPFVPQLTTAPDDLTLVVSYTGTKMSYTAATAVDSTGAVWVSSQDTNSLNKFSTTGVQQVATVQDLNAPGSLVIDSNDNIWTTNLNASSLVKFDSAGTLLGQYSPSGYQASSLITQPYFDASDNLWLANGTGALAEISATNGSLLASVGASTLSNKGSFVAINPSGQIWAGTSTGSFAVFSSDGSSVVQTLKSASPVSSVNWISFDKSGNAWISDDSSNELAIVNPSTMSVTTSTNSAGGVYYPLNVVEDANNQLWVANLGYAAISALTFDGSNITAVSPSSGYASPLDNAYELSSLQLDASGNVWAGDDQGDLLEWIGIAAPQATPLTYSNIATRP